MTDLTYTTKAGETTFVPETAAGVTVWNQMAEQLGGSSVVVLSIHTKDVVAQLRKAGYKVSKSASKKQATIEALYAELTDSEFAIDNMYAELTA